MIGDGTVNIQDLVRMVDFIIHQEDQQLTEVELFFGDCGPINFDSPLDSGDEVISIFDVITVLNIILYSNLKCIEEDGSQPYYDWTGSTAIPGDIVKICPTYEEFLNSEKEKRN